MLAAAHEHCWRFLGTLPKASIWQHCPFRCVVVFRVEHIVSAGDRPFHSLASFSFSLFLFFFFLHSRSAHSFRLPLPMCRLQASLPKTRFEGWLLFPQGCLFLRSPSTALAVASPGRSSRRHGQSSFGQSVTSPLSLPPPPRACVYSVHACQCVAMCGNV